MSRHKRPSQFAKEKQQAFWRRQRSPAEPRVSAFRFWGTGLRGVLAAGVAGCIGRTHRPLTALSGSTASTAWRAQQSHQQPGARRKKYAGDLRPANGNCTMSMSSKRERSLLSHEEHEIVRVTYHPAIYEHDVEELQALRMRLRQLRAKERTLARQKQRELRGKADSRGGRFPGIADLPLHRKQIFSAALKRVNKEWGRIHKLEARTAHVEAARRALALRRAAQFVPYPMAGNTAHEGMQPLPSRRRRMTLSRDKIGSISQRTKIAQAARDSRR